MGRDKVLGLSLAILLIGFAAAFCFRNEPFVESGLKLARAKILDEAIAQRPGPKPYASVAKAERNKSSLPTVTLQGIESIEPFADLQTASTADREESTPAKDNKEKTKKLLPIATARAEIKPPAETSAAEIGTLTGAIDTGSASADSDRSGPQIQASKPAKVAANPDVEGSLPPSSRLLTSAEPPAGDPSIGESPGGSSDIVIRPLSPLGGRTDSPVQQNAAWQSTPAHREHGPVADNSPRNGSQLEDSASDDPPRANASRENPARENPARENSTRDNPPRENSARDIPARDIPVTENPVHDNPATVDPPRDDPRSDADGSPKGLTHRVRRGDTLTKIALHYLGASSRYREIYEANRDQLRSPNDRLKIGMTLRIPPDTAKPGGSVARRKPRANRSGHAAAENARSRKLPIRNVARVRETPPAAPVDNPPAGSSDDEKTNADPRPTNRFVPVRTSPFLPNKTETEAPPPPPPENREGTTPDMSHYRFFSRTAPIRIAGDREDAVVR